MRGITICGWPTGSFALRPQRTQELPGIASLSRDYQGATPT